MSSIPLEKNLVPALFEDLLDIRIYVMAASVVT